MTTIEAMLRRAIEASGPDLILTLDPAFQGLPDAAHGGSVLAVFDALAGVAGARRRGAAVAARPRGAPTRLGARGARRAGRAARAAGRGPGGGGRGGGTGAGAGVGAAVRGAACGFSSALGSALGRSVPPR